MMHWPNLSSKSWKLCPNGDWVLDLDCASSAQKRFSWSSVAISFGRFAGITFVFLNHHWSFSTSIIARRLETIVPNRLISTLYFDLPIASHWWRTFKRGLLSAFSPHSSTCWIAWNRFKCLHWLVTRQVTTGCDLLSLESIKTLQLPPRAIAIRKFCL